MWHNFVKSLKFKFKAVFEVYALYASVCIGFTLWSELTLKASRLWASFITLELLHNAKIEAINKFEKDTLLWVEISLQKQHWCHLFALSCNAFGWDSHNKLRRIKSMMFTSWNLPINYCSIIKMYIFILINELILKWKCLQLNKNFIFSFNQHA